MKKNADLVEFTFEAYGEGNSEGVISCYIEALKTVTKGDIDTMCSTDAVVDEWEVLTGKTFGELEATALVKQKDGKGGANYEFADVVTTETFDAK